MKTSDTVSETYKALLHDELSAIENYTEVIEKFPDEPGAQPLQHIRADHEASADALRKIIGKNGESPSLVPLQHDKIHGISEYEDAFKEDKLDESIKNSIRYELLPALRLHLVELGYCKSNTLTQIQNGRGVAGQASPRNVS